MNGLKTFGLMAIMTFLLMALGGFLGGSSGVVMALIFAGIGNIISYWFSDKLVLKAYKAQPVDESHWLYKMVDALAVKADLPTPKVYILNQSQANAFATGRNPEHAAVAVTQGLIEMMDKDELSGVVAHELGHIKNRDILVGTVAATLAGAISYMGYATRFGTGSRSSGGGNNILFIVALVLAPIAATMIRMAISRTREYKADAFGAKISGNPLFLSNALRKLESGRKRVAMKGNPSTSHLFIVHPFSGRSLASLFSTHPKTEERIRRLEEMTLQKEDISKELDKTRDVETSRGYSREERKYNR